MSARTAVLAIVAVPGKRHPEDFLNSALGMPRALDVCAPVADYKDRCETQVLFQPQRRHDVVYKITIGRPDIDLREQGAAINARMGLNTWAAFAGAEADAMVAGDVAMLEHEVTPVLEALRTNDLSVVSIHHHMTDVKPVVIFLHYYGTGPAAKLAHAVRSAVDLLGKTPSNHP